MQIYRRSLRFRSSVMFYRLCYCCDPLSILQRDFFRFAYFIAMEIAMTAGGIEKRKKNNCYCANLFSQREKSLGRGHRKSLVTQSSKIIREGFDPPQLAPFDYYVATSTF